MRKRMILIMIEELDDIHDSDVGHGHYYGILVAIAE